MLGRSLLVQLACPVYCFGSVVVRYVGLVTNPPSGYNARVQKSRIHRTPRALRSALQTFLVASPTPNIDSARLGKFS